MSEIGSTICAVAQNSATLIFGRSVESTGGAGMASGSFVMVAFTAPPKLHPTYMGTMGGTYVVTVFIGPLGGVLTQAPPGDGAFGSTCLLVLPTPPSSASSPSRPEYLSPCRRRSKKGSCRRMFWQGLHPVYRPMLPTGHVVKRCQQAVESPRRNRHAHRFVCPDHCLHRQRVVR